MHSAKTITEQQLKHFGLLLGGIIVCLFGMILPYLFHQSPHHWPFYIGLPLLLVARVRPQILKHLYQVWMKMGAVLGWINTRILLAFIYFFIFTPIGLVMRLVKSDSMQRKFDPELTSYRKNCTAQQKSHMEKPF